MSVPKKTTIDWRVNKINILDITYAGSNNIFGKITSANITIKSWLVFILSDLAESRVSRVYVMSVTIPKDIWQCLQATVMCQVIFSTHFE